MNPLLRAQLRDALIFWIWIPAAVIGTGEAFDLLLSLPPLPFPLLLRACGVLLFAAGAAVISRATSDFRRLGGGTPNPMAPPKSLVTGGIYSRCRHPMWFGYDLCALGVIVFLRSMGTLLLPFPLFLLLQYLFLTRREEPRLVRRFGEAYTRYRASTRLLLPVRGRREH